jgi:NDP-sugar pyrophosphorylase family protein
MESGDPQIAQGGRLPWLDREVQPSPMRADSVAQVSAIVLARGYGRQVDRAADFFRHPLLPLALMPMVEYVLRWIGASGRIRQVAVCAQDATAGVQAWASKTPIANLSLVFSQDQRPRGPAGAVRDASGLVTAARYLVVEGTRLPTLDLNALLIEHEASGAAITTVIDVERRRRSGAGARYPGGIYVFEQEAVDLIRPTGFQDIKQGLLELVNQRNLGVHMVERGGLTPTVVDQPSYMATTRWLVSTVDERHVFYPEYRTHGDGLLHPSAVIADDAMLVGPVLVGPGARIESNAVIVGPTVIGRDVHVGANATVARSAVMDGARIGAGSNVDHAVLVPGAVIAPRATIDDRLVWAESTGTSSGAFAEFADMPSSSPSGPG